MYLSDMRTQLQLCSLAVAFPKVSPCSSTVWLSRNSLTSTMIDIWYFVSYWMLSENYFSPRGKIVCLKWTEPELPFCFVLGFLLFLILYFSAWSFPPMFVHVLLQWCYFVVVLFYVLFCDISGSTTLCQLDPSHVNALSWKTFECKAAERVIRTWHVWRNTLQKMNLVRKVCPVVWKGGKIKELFKTPIRSVRFSGIFLCFLSRSKLVYPRVKNPTSIA